MFQFCRFVIMGLTAVLLLSACGGTEETAVSVDSRTPASTFLPTATATLVPTHTATVTPLPTYTPTATPSPTASPTETRTPRPSATPKPTTDPEPTTTWDRYQVRTLESIKELTDPFIEESLAKYPSVYLEMSDEYHYPSQVRVIYSGQFREISADRLFAIARFFEAYLPDMANQFIPLYQHEVLVQEGNDKYWMPVQEPLIPYMEDELQIGGKASLFLTWMGAIKNGPDEVERIYLINEFQK